MRRFKFSGLTSYWLPVLSGVMMLLATPYVGMWPLVSFALVPFFLHVFSAPHTFRRIAVATLLMAVPYSFGAVEALYRLSGEWWGVATEGQLFTPALIYMLGVSGLILFVAASYIVPMLLVRKVNVTSWRLPLLLALGFALTEFIRSSIFLAGYSWGTMGYLLIDTQYVKHVASIASVFGLTFVLIFWSAWLAQLIIRYQKNSGTLRMRMCETLFGHAHVRETIIIVIACIAILACGIYKEALAPVTKLHMRVAVIASDIRTEESISAGSYRTYRALLLSALAQKPDLILTPENVFPYFVLDEDGYVLAKQQPAYLPDALALWEDLLALTREYPDTTFALGLHTYGAGKTYNSILLYKNGTMQSIYHKRKPIPFTEYAPLGMRLNLFETLSAGDETQDFHLGDMALGGYICSEVGITPLSIHGASLILSPSNDSALLNPSILPLQHQFARMKALEEGAYMLRSARGGISSIIDPNGNALAETSGQNGILVLDI